MRLCRNLITDYLTANFTEDEPVWTGDPTVYNNGDEAREDHIIYKYAGISGTNTATTPSLNPEDWLEYKTSNYYAMLGERTIDQTITSGDLIIEITSQNYDTLSLLNVVGSQIDIEMKDSMSNIVFTDSYDLNNNIEIVDAYSYYFNPFEFFTGYYTQIPIYPNSTIKITITAASGTAAIGRLVCGQGYGLGINLYGATFSLESFSRTDFDEFGSATLIHREAVYNSQYVVVIPSVNVPRLQRKRKELDAIPILFIGDESEESDYENLLSYGLWQGADMLLRNPVNSELNLTIKELL